MSNSWFILLHDDDELVLNDAIFLRLNDIDCMSVGLFLITLCVIRKEDMKLYGVAFPLNLSNKVL